MHPKISPIIDHFALTPEWLIDRMLFIAGPRQVGKTTYIKNKIKTLGGSYFNWDNPDVSNAYSERSSFFVDTSKANTIVAFDEIHKKHKWKDILKGIYDVHKNNYQFVITGSARLDTFRRSGDSLVGRYFLAHMFPLSVAELQNQDFEEITNAQTLIQKMQENNNLSISDNDLDSLIKLGGFPEPFFSGSETTWRRWQKQHHELLIREDLRDLSNIQKLDSIAVLAKLLRERVSGTLSYNSLTEDLQTDNKTIKNWISQLEKIMLVFQIKPWYKQITNSIRKNPKIYFYDWSYLENPGARFENFIAAQLYRTVTLWNDRYGYDFGLYFVRDYQNNEIDFCITLNSKPWLLIEAKHGYPEWKAGFNKLKDELKVPAIVVTNEKNWNSMVNDVYVVSTKRFLEVLS
jgi:hypothetical protein